LRLAELTKIFGATRAVDRVSLGIEPSSMVALLGPSGCGKTTTLRMIAGLLQPNAGEIYLDGVPISRIPVHRRKIGMLFQNYALFPHMTVAQNIAFGLEMRHLPRTTIAERVDEVLQLVQLGGFGERMPSQLSGGQQQRVALARAIVIEPALLLLDEPLGALDKSLRQSMQVELRALQRRLGITTIMVTHDQDEALTMADRIVIMRDGQIEQAGPPEEVYQHPLSRFTASFLGASNFFRGQVTSNKGGALAVVVPNGPMLSMRTSREVGSKVSVALRPEAIAIDFCGETTVDEAVNRTPCLVDQLIYHGFVTHLHLRLPNGDPMLAYVRPGTDLATRSIAPGVRVVARWSADALQIVREEPE